MGSGERGYLFVGVFPLARCHREGEGRGGVEGEGWKDSLAICDLSSILIFVYACEVKLSLMKERMNCGYRETRGDLHHRGRGGG